MSYVSRIEPSHTDAGTAYVTFDNHRNADYSVYIFATKNYGDSFLKLNNGIPPEAGTVHAAVKRLRQRLKGPPMTASELLETWQRLSLARTATLLRKVIDLISVDDFAQHELGTKAEPVPQTPQAPARSSIHVA